jgi:hypothetical protein
MAKPTMIPTTVPDTATSGEKRVYRILRDQLPEGYTAWHELTLSYRKRSIHPDFIIIGPDEGVIVIEVKDWVLDNITEVKQTLFFLRTRVAKHDPFRQAREGALVVNNLLQSSNDPLIVNQSGDHKGHLKFPYRNAVVLTNLTRAEMKRFETLKRILENKPVLVKDDMDSHFVERLFELPSHFQAKMTKRQIDTARYILFPEERISDKRGKVVDLTQANLIKSHLSEEAQRAAGDPATRLVRGPAGSGKSLVLIKRAILESVSHPEWRILVLTYNRNLSYYLQHLINDGDEVLEQNNLEIVNFHTWCRRSLKAIGYWQSPIDSRTRRRLIKQAIAETGRELWLSQDFIAEEINWMKENDILTWEEYREVDRQGRGIGLKESARKQVYGIFENYEKLLGDNLDWDDVPLRVLDCMANHLIAIGTYEAVFVDEAQDFAPSWFKVIKLLVNPKTSILFLAADATQRIYRTGFSWRSLGLNVQGRTTVLRKSYRNPPAIQRLAYSLVKGDKGLQRELVDAGEELIEPEIEEESKIAGVSNIKFKRIRNERLESQYICKQISILREVGYEFSDIAIFHRYSWGVREVANSLRNSKIPVSDAKVSDIDFSKAEVRVCTLHASKGLEFPVVFICGLDRVNYGLKFRPRDPDQEANWLENWIIEEKKLLYVGITRATETLYLSYHGPLPGFIQELEHDYRVQIAS